jgi:plasmid stabilization system protein ParE
MSKRKARTIRWSANAMRDLDQIAAYIARDDPQAARIVPEIQRDDVREVFLRSYRIVYGVRDDHIFVFTVFGGGKQRFEDAVPRG